MLARTRLKQKQHYKLKTIDELHPAIKNIIGIAKGVKDNGRDLNGRQAHYEYLRGKYV